MFNPLKYFRRRTVGLALGSGGAKGVSHIAVIEYLQSLNIPIHMIAGSSIGAVVGAVYGAGKLGEFKRDLLKMGRKELLSLVDPVFPRSGMVEGKKLVDFMARYIGPEMKIEDLSVPLSIIATDYYSGAPVVFRSGCVLDALRASVSIPGVFTPMKLGDTFLIDGGVASPVPLDVVRRMGANLTVAVNLHPTVEQRRLWRMVKRAIGRDEDGGDVREAGAADIGYLHQEKEPRNHWLESVERWLGIGVGKRKEYELKTPSIFQVISQSIDIMEYMNTTMLLRHYRPTVLIQPELGDIGSLDFTQSRRALEGGYRACEKARGRLVRKIRYWT